MSLMDRSKGASGSYGESPGQLLASKGGPKSFPEHPCCSPGSLAELQMIPNGDPKATPKCSRGGVTFDDEPRAAIEGLTVRKHCKFPYKTSLQTNPPDPVSSAIGNPPFPQQTPNPGS